MKVALVKYISVEITDHASFINSFSDNISNHFSNKFYGNDIETILIGIICVSQNFEQFFKPRRPKYTKDKKHVKNNEFEYDIEKCFEYDLKLDFETFKNASKNEAKKYLSEEILRSLEIIESMKSKFKDFDFENFKKDLKDFFKSYTLDTLN